MTKTTHRKKRPMPSPLKKPSWPVFPMMLLHPINYFGSLCQKKNASTKRCKRSPGLSQSSISQTQLIHTPTAASESFFPCRTCDPSEGKGLNLKPWDLDTETLVQRIDPKMLMGDRQVAKNQRLIPYHNNADNTCEVNNNERQDSISLTWCPVLCPLYEKQFALSNMERRALRKYLQRILDHAILQQQKLEEQKVMWQQEQLSLEEEEKVTPTIQNEEELEVPYTQNWGNEETAHRISSSEPKEPLRPGDVISYQSHVYVAGDKRGLRVATVIQVRPKEDPILCLDNNEYLLPTTYIKRIRVMKRGSLEEHPQGLYREVQEFKLSKAGPLPGHHKSTEAQRLERCVKNFQDQYIQLAEEHGMPVDLLNKGTHKGANSTSNTSEEFPKSTSTSKKKGRPKESSYSSRSTEKKDLKQQIEIGGKPQTSTALSSQIATSDSDIDSPRKQGKRKKTGNKEKVISTALSPASNLRTRKKDEVVPPKSTKARSKTPIGNSSPLLSRKSRRKSASDVVPEGKTSISKGSFKNQLTVTRRKK